MDVVAFQLEVLRDGLAWLLSNLEAGSSVIEAKRLEVEDIFVGGGRRFSRLGHYGAHW